MKCLRSFLLGLLDLRGLTKRADLIGPMSYKSRAATNIAARPFVWVAQLCVGCSSLGLCVLFLEVAHEVNECFNAFFWHGVVDGSAHTTNAAMAL